MTTSDDMTTLADAFDLVKLSPGAAGTLLQWLGQQVGHDTEAGAALRDGGIAVTNPPETPVAKTSTSSTSTTSRAGSST